MVRPANSFPRMLWTRERGGIAVLALLAWALPTIAWGQKPPVGPEFQVNTITTGYQGIFHGPAIASDATGNFVVVWNTRYGGYSYGSPIISGRRFDSGGAPKGAEFMIASFPPEEDSADSPHVASDSAGNFVVVWQSYQTAYGLGDTSYTGIVGKRYDSSGSVVGSEFLVNAYTTGFQTNPKIASDSAGNFVVVWHQYEQYGSYGFISGRRFDSSRNALGDQFQINSSSSYMVGYTGLDEDPDGIEIASGPAGNFMVVWNEWLRDGDDNGIFARAYDSAGNPIGNDFRVNSYTTGDQTYPGVAADGSGNFVLVWSGRGPGTYFGIFARRYDSTGGMMGTEFQVNAEPRSSSTYANVKVATDATGSFVVAWQAYPRIEGRPFDSEGIPIGGDFVVTPLGGYSYTSPYTPDLAAQAAGDFVVVWREMGYSYYGDGWEIFGQRIGEAGPFGCTPAPKTGCRPQTTGRGGSIVLKDKSPDTKDSVVWRWVRGSETDREDFGDPLTDTDYVLCLYDASTNPQPRLQARAPAGGICAGIYPCWKELGPLRLDYTDRDADPDGLRLVRLMAGPEGKARINVRGKGANLDMPALPLVPPVTVQLQASNGECWKAEYEEFIQENQADCFKAKAGSPSGAFLAIESSLLD